MLRIHHEFSRQELTNCTKLARQLAVSTKTVLRDIAFMRDRLQLPIEFDPELQAYRYTEPVTNFPTIQVSEGELMALLVAQRALEQYRGTPFHRQLSVAFEKISGGLKDHISFSPSNDLQAVSFRNIGLGKSDLVVFDTLSEAVLKRRVVKFAYRKPGETIESDREVEPYHLSHRENLWYLIGVDRGRRALRTFAVPRISAITLTKNKFVRSPDFVPEKFFASALGVLGGEADNRIVVRFQREAADRVREREWHETQTMHELPDGSMELSMRLGALPEVARWVLSWGGAAEVIDPPALRRLLYEVGKNLVSIYKKEGNPPNA
jgi:predicted DNA-binding transcriptional regulator YafY